MKSNILNYDYEKFDFRKFFVKNVKREINIYYKNYQKKKTFRKSKRNKKK